MPAEHILIYARTLEGGGVERAMLRLARGWRAAGRRVTLVTGAATGPLVAEIPPGITLIDRGDPRWRSLLALPAIVDEVRPDVIFCPGNYYTVHALWLRARLGRRCPPIVAKLSNSPQRGDHGWLFDRVHRRWLSLHRRFLDRLVAMTPASAAQAEALYDMAGRIDVIANPPALPIAGARPVPLPPGRIVLGVGRLREQKRWDRLVATLPRLPSDVSLVILGEGPLRPALEAQAAALGVADRLHLPGHVADPLATMPHVAVLALVSDYEGVPGVLREALSVGTPVVTTRSSVAIDEIVTTPTLGTIVAADDTDALADALRHWLTAPRPAPVPPPGADAAVRYLGVFDSLVA
ncbi:glycosyltransferase involved in cell wall biosynthesis [Sphingomonas jinjuensis]|uniref:Glycosyltransferase involved in cell wall biosynthesis n=1 Tax=Sphingomonas jinjuensis TaxID=535907 RepID=A0A840FH26_9SPHN|nr:glycosyltransferase [Sphingomonas jinjuensis]MBB4154987.1 glycosyltransferase involved in cell wall biosynthesis [Sphingomonas jinjuensis]